MTRRGLGLMVTLVWMVSACHSLPAKRQAPVPANKAAAAESSDAPAASESAPPGADDAPKSETAEIPPCLPTDSNPKPAPKRKPKPVVKVEPPPPAPAPEPTLKAAEEAGVKTVLTPSSSILGRKVRGQEGDDLGRVVDVLADAHGRVRIAIIEFGGFLGVGNRRIAVDWSLLKFQPDDPDAPVLLEVAKRKLQETPEYKGAEHPMVLTGPGATAAARTTTPH